MNKILTDGVYLYATNGEWWYGLPSWPLNPTIMVRPGCPYCESQVAYTSERHTGGFIWHRCSCEVEISYRKIRSVGYSHLVYEIVGVSPRSEICKEMRCNSEDTI